MKYGFYNGFRPKRKKIPLQWNRLRLTGSSGRGKQKEGFDIIPMWVADMNFRPYNDSSEAIIERDKTYYLRLFLAPEKNILMLLSNGTKQEMA